MSNLYQAEGAFEYDNLIAGNGITMITKGVLLKSGQGILKRGTVLGVVTDDGLAVMVDKTKTNGSQICDSILTDDIDTGTTDNVIATAYITGYFDKKALVFADETTINDCETELRKLGIYVTTRDN